MNPPSKKQNYYIYKSIVKQEKYNNGIFYHLFYYPQTKDLVEEAIRKYQGVTFGINCECDEPTKFEGVHFHNLVWFANKGKTSIPKKISDWIRKVKKIKVGDAKTKKFTFKEIKDKLHLFRTILYIHTKKLCKKEYGKGNDGSWRVTSIVNYNHSKQTMGGICFEDDSERKKFEQEYRRKDPFLTGLHTDQWERCKETRRKRREFYESGGIYKKRNKKLHTPVEQHGFQETSDDEML